MRENERGLVADTQHEATATDPFLGRGPFEHPKFSLRDHVRAAEQTKATSCIQHTRRSRGRRKTLAMPVLPVPW